MKKEEDEEGIRRKTAAEGGSRTQEGGRRKQEGGSSTEGRKTGLRGKGVRRKHEYGRREKQ